MKMNEEWVRWKAGEEQEKIIFDPNFFSDGSLCKEVSTILMIEKRSHVLSVEHLRETLESFAFLLKSALTGSLKLSESHLSTLVIAIINISLQCLPIL